MNQIKQLKIQYINMKVPDLKNICRERKIKGYSKLRKLEIIDLIIKNTKIEKNKCCKTCNKKIEKEECITYSNNTYEHLECYNKKNNLHIIKHNCSICMEDIEKEDEFKTECSHYFHKKCIEQWDRMDTCRNKCPNCRQQMKSIMSFTKIHSEMVRTTEYLQSRDNGLTPMILNEYDNLMFQAVYLQFLFKRLNNNNLQTQNLVDLFYVDINSYVDSLVSNGFI